MEKVEETWEQAQREKIWWKRAGIRQYKCTVCAYHADHVGILATNTCARYGHLQSLSDPAWRSRVGRAARAHWLVQTSAREFTHKMFASAALGNHCWVELKRLSGIIRSMVAPEMYTVDTCALFTITIWRQEAVII